MLTDEDLKRLDRIHLALETGGSVTDVDVSWMCKRLKDVAKSRPDEFDFPAYAALVDPSKEKAYALRYYEKPPLQVRTKVTPGAFAEGLTLFQHCTSVRVTDALLVVRPWVRAEAGTAYDVLEELRACWLTLAVDDETPVRRAPVSDFLLGADGSAVRLKSPSIELTDGLIYRATQFDSENNADPGKPLGIFLANNTDVTLTLLGKTGPSRPVTLVAGLTAAVYSTAGGVRRGLSSP